MVNVGQVCTQQLPVCFSLKCDLVDHGVYDWLSHLMIMSVN